MDTMPEQFGDAQLVRDVVELRQQLVHHPIYRRIATPQDLRIYMRHHVFAVWDFMSLLKRLQRDLTGIEIPWMPRANPEFTRFINEIVLDEESDQDGDGGYASHFTLYRRAMTEMGADEEPIHKFLALLGQNSPLISALSAVGLPESTAEFVRNTLEVAQQGATHEVAAAFFYGREDVIPDMFRRMVGDALPEQGSQRSERFVYYLRRHIELDGDQHGPLAERLLPSLCGESQERWNEAFVAAKKALRARIHLWDGILAEIEAG